MGLRETLNEHPSITTGVTAGIIVIVLAFILWPSGGGSSGGGSTDAKVYFSVDDGKTWFAEDAKKVPPFDHNGKQAVRARVFRSGGKEFVNYLQRFTPDAQKKMQAIYDSSTPVQDPTVFEVIQQQGMEVKKPGEAKWVKMGDPASAKVLTAPASGADLEEIQP